MVKELHGINVVQDCQSILVAGKKIVATYQLANTNDHKQLFTDGTSRCQTVIQNVVVGIHSNGGYKIITLSYGILPENKTSKLVT